MDAAEAAKTQRVPSTHAKATPPGPQTVGLGQPVLWPGTYLFEYVRSNYGLQNKVVYAILDYPIHAIIHPDQSVQQIPCCRSQAWISHTYAIQS